MISIASARRGEAGFMVEGDLVAALPVLLSRDAQQFLRDGAYDEAAFCVDHSDLLPIPELDLF